MSCQSMAASRAFTDNEKEIACGSFHRSVRFSSESRSSTRTPRDVDAKRETPGSISLLALSVSPTSGPSGSIMSQSAGPSTSLREDDCPPPPASCRFPKLEECAHFHYDRVSLGGLSIKVIPCDDTHQEDLDSSEGWIYLNVQSHVNMDSEGKANEVTEWTLSRNAHNLLQLDDMLHRCIYDRKVSGLPNLTHEITETLIEDRECYERLISDYVHHLSIIADNSINCGPVLNWMQMDNKGHKLLVSNEDSSSINTPAVAAAYSVRKYVSQARDEISFEVGDMISIIDMPGPQESLWWRGKRGFRVGFFPHHCVAVIGDKVPRHMTQPPPIVGSVAMAPIKPVLRKHGKLISLFRSFILSRPSRRSLKQQGILKERVFGCDLGEHLLNCGRDVPLVLSSCCASLERRAPPCGVYRLSGAVALTQRLRAAFDEDGPAPDLGVADVTRDPHAVASLLKLYFRELPNPLCTYQLYDSFISAVTSPAASDAERLQKTREVVIKLPPPHYRTLAYLMRHLRRVSLLGAQTGMTARNMAIVWAPNLLRSPQTHHALHHVAHQAVVTEFLICYAEELFSQEQGELTEIEPEIEPKRQQRPKSLPVSQPSKLISLSEAQANARNPTNSMTTDTANLNNTLRPTGTLRPKYIEVGSGPSNLPQYHTVLDLPVSGTKRGLKRSPSGWRTLFSRNKQQRPPLPTHSPPIISPPQEPPALRPVKSCESLSETDVLPPLTERPQPVRQHTRSSSCDSYFEPWQVELADMRLRLSPQERRNYMFSEEDGPQESISSSPIVSDACSVEPSPCRRTLRVDLHLANDCVERKRSAIEDELASIGYIDGGDSPLAKPVLEKRNEANAAKRVCKDRDSPKSTIESPTTSSIVNVRMRDRNSPRKAKNPNRYSNVHHAVNSNDQDKLITINQTNRLSWHGKDGHSTLIKINWPLENNSISNLTTSTINSSPVTPQYDQLETDSDTDRQNNKCCDEKCLKCELNDAEIKSVKTPESERETQDSLEHSPLDVSYHFNRLSAVSTSSNSDQEKRKEYEHLLNDRKSVMTSSHESSSSYSNSKTDDIYETYNYNRPTYLNLQSSGTSKSSASSPLKSPLKSTISITFRSPKNKCSDYELIDNNDTPIVDRDSVYEDVEIDKSLTIVEDATVPNSDGNLPTQQACQPTVDDLIILETPTKDSNNADVYSQVKFFKKSIEEVNALMIENPKERHYENVPFSRKPVNDYENITVRSLKITDGDKVEVENGNTVKKSNLNVRELATKFESPTEQKGPFTFEKFKAEIKYPTLEKDKKDAKPCKGRSKIDDVFVKEFTEPILDLKEIDLNLNEKPESITPVTENKISLIQRFDKPDLKNFGIEADKELSRERIEKYKEERRNFLREKYSSQSFRSNLDDLTKLKVKKDVEDISTDDIPKFERRNTVDIGQRMRFSLAKSANDLDNIESPTEKNGVSCFREAEDEARSTEFDRREKMSPSYNIRDMAAMFEQKSQNNGTG